MYMTELIGMLPIGIAVPVSTQRCRRYVLWVQAPKPA